MFELYTEPAYGIGHWTCSILSCLNRYGVGVIFGSGCPNCPKQLTAKIVLSRLLVVVVEKVLFDKDTEVLIIYVVVVVDAVWSS